MSVNTTIRSNYNPEIWGPKGWFFLDTIILSYPINPDSTHKKIYQEFFKNIGKMLPCQGCRDNYSNHILINPLNDNHLMSRDNLINWWITIHNMARNSMNKELLSPTTFLNYYYKCYSSGNTEYVINDTNSANFQTENNFLNLVYILLLIFAIFMFKKIISNKNKN
jgi:hypothetical protein